MRLEQIILEPQAPWLLRVGTIFAAVIMTWSVIGLWVPGTRRITIGRKRPDEVPGRSYEEPTASRKALITLALVLVGGLTIPMLAERWNKMSFATNPIEFAVGQELDVVRYEHEGFTQHESLIRFIDDKCGLYNLKTGEIEGGEAGHGAARAKHSPYRTVGLYARSEGDHCVVEIER